MNKELLKKPWILTLLLLGISIVLGLLLSVIIDFFGLGSTGMSSVSSIVGAMIVGQIYAANFKELMPKKLRINVTIIYNSIQFVLGFLLGLILFPEIVLEISSFFLFLGILLGFCVLFSFVIYFMLGTGGKAYLKSTEKRSRKS